MKLEQKRAEKIETKMAAKSSFVGINVSQTGSAYVWVDNTLEDSDCLVYENGSLLYAGSSLIRSSAGKLSSIKSVRFSGKHRLLVETESDAYDYFDKEAHCPAEFSLLVLGKHRAKLLFIVADRNFCVHPTKIELDNSFEAQQLFITAVHDLIQRRDPSTASLLDCWVKDSRLLFRNS